VLRQRVEQLTAEANQCLGEEMAFLEKTDVRMTGGENLPGDTTAYPPTDDTIVSGPPLIASGPTP
jgi:hypothetical protein